MSLTKNVNTFCIDLVYPKLANVSVKQPTLKGELLDITI